ncbi:hypothetical protein [Acidovorax delafieldii]|uniref:hypothetical protein n=1 Tax=Acidovorax delafieldii TaxID=47920 RepID=UPI003ED05F09
MTQKFEDSLAFKTFLYCPVPGLDLVAGAAVMAASAAAEVCADGIKSAVKDGVMEAVGDCQREAITAAEAALGRQIAPIISGLEAIASSVAGSASKPPDNDTSVNSN